MSSLMLRWLMQVTSLLPARLRSHPGSQLAGRMLMSLADREGPQVDTDLDATVISCIFQLLPPAIR